MRSSLREDARQHPDISERISPSHFYVCLSLNGGGGGGGVRG